MSIGNAERIRRREPHTDAPAGSLWYSWRHCRFQVDRPNRPEEMSMSTGRQIRSYDYVNHPYDRVRDLLKQNALAVFQSATKAAAVTRRVRCCRTARRFRRCRRESRHQDHCEGRRGETRRGYFQSEHEAASGMEAATLPRLFPLMRGELSVYPLTSTETQLDFSGVRAAFRRGRKNDERDRRPSYR